MEGLLRSLRLNQIIFLMQSCKKVVKFTKFLFSYLIFIVPCSDIHTYLINYIVKTNLLVSF